MSADTLPAPLLALAAAHVQGCPHATRVAELARRAAPMLHLDPDTAATAGLLHDLGKALIPGAILDAPRALTETEWNVMRRHPEHSHALVQAYWPDAPAAVLDAVLHHHEDPRGGGYPSGGRELSPLTTLIRALDIYDALTEDRPYRAALSREAAFSELERSAVAPDVLHAVRAVACHVQ